jgi:hypothetical protein
VINRDLVFLVYLVETVLHAITGWARRVVATTLKKRLLGAFLALVALLGSNWLSYNTGKTHGNIEGVSFYHHMCYNNGGMVINEAGEAVLCAPLVKIPEEEMKPLDNLKNT